MEETSALETVGPIVATAEPAEAVLDGLDRRIRELETAVRDLHTMKAQGESVSGRKTAPASQVSVMAKGSTEEANSAAFDDALRTLSMEQRFAVKSGLIRAGLLR